MEQHDYNSAADLPKAAVRAVDAASRAYAAKRLGCGLLFLAMSMGVLAYWTLQFNKGLDPVTRFWIILPLATIGMALFLLVNSLGIILSSLPLFTAKPRPGTSIEDTVTRFYKGVLPRSKLFNPPYHEAWICLLASARVEFGSLKEFRKYWARCEYTHFSVAHWDISVKTQQIEGDEADVAVGLRQSSGNAHKHSSERSETAKLRKVGKYWFLTSGRYPPEEKIREDLKKANEEVAAEWSSCAKCKHPVRRVVAEQMGGFCEACFEKARSSKVQ